MMKDLCGSLFDLQDNRLDKLGNPLLSLDKTIDWEKFRKILDQANRKQRKNNAGAESKDSVMMFKGLVIQNLYGLSDDQLEYQIEDRRSFQRFLCLSNHQRSPDAKTFWAFRNRLSELNLIDQLFNELSKQLNKAGYVARKGQIIDASIVAAPIQRNTREENSRLKQGDVAQDWKENKHRQKDTDARWVNKHGKSKYGYKNHVSVDNKNKLIRNYDVTDASVHDSNVFERLLDVDNRNGDVWADSAYSSKEKEETLSDLGFRSRIHRKGKRGKGLSDRSKQANVKKSKVRCRVEHIFGAQSGLRKKEVRSIGIIRASTEIGLMNIVYNMRRLCFLEGISTS